MSDVRKVGVVGAGQMGSGIAEVHAKSGLDVVITEVSQSALDAGKARIEKSLQRAVKNGKLAADDADAALGRLRFTTDLADLADRDLVIEAILEQEQAKVDVFGQLDKIVSRDDAIFASNTSSIPIVKIGMATQRPAQVVGIHFFNPVPVLPLVELVPSLLTSDETARRAEEHAAALGKTVIRAQDRAGFIVNSLLVPYLLSAIRMVESGFATAEDIDRGMELGTAHPMGPLRLSDLIGLDTVKAIADSMYDEFKEPLYAAPPLLLRMVDAGLLGKKSGRGFYSY
ncbi:3-hydroxybutyryl-CoA dehydrogenase [Amycolatopsis sp. FDAARGOS 1241]|uniref:3-hydroxybutyryl-CoA dehydrogenase n=1 Tax=Amycolatopsis sp. FDAARGOS 1241 TaxID=2778070 RepID=UPI00194F6944|nr:3-hydroxybutyryl-CoA dehydrogenase [Amycolatopsis sp. FDAARGOS 1241]QRP46365.1 3-hydroxybutyryl-CoA dehydrogenase [Amycolatopsis sp. FDAARGOS 1241]